MRAQHQRIEHTLGGSWVRERRIVGILLRLAFACAGVLWLLLPWVELDAQTRGAFTAMQYQLYLLLLTLWGYDYRRQVRRLSCVLAVADAQSCPPSQVRWEHIDQSGQSGWFDVLLRRRHSRQWFPVVFTWVLLIASYLWLGRQIVSIAQILQR
ncbi:MAG: hypothetical protein RML15_02810 [Bacteroidota bacterium]|nr:hypothetical protein [Candidatus Kapabacteria bacterium]MCS7302556.1 hypothetical protein [Candidatus Kapabacteria bacterium]MCX7936758.1 hypothetical protein [Chlorobiota bacterium]MDW8074198.1 hypothetical protein [Bacteroidota bacterium]MDW8271326.1 hypothetical protein [Bacteroidota bacterium]